MKDRSAELLIPLTVGLEKKKKKPGSVLDLALPWPCQEEGNQGFRMGSCSAGNHSSLDVSLHQQAPCSLTFMMIRTGCLNVVAGSRFPPCSEQLLLRPPLRS